MENYQQALQLIQKSKNIDFENSFELSKICANYLSNEHTEKEGRDLVIRILDSKSKIDSKTFPIIYDLIDIAGLYPYLEKENLIGSSRLRYEYHKSRFLKDIYFHEEQQYISLQLLSNNSVVLSAPTSFGKSLLIEEVVVE